MAVPAGSALRWPQAKALTSARVAVPLGLGLIGAISVLLRTERFDVGFWIDEGLSVGIADRPLTDIPGVLRQDGSPPLYYLLLHLWIRLTGDTGEPGTHALSLILATLTIPVAFVLVAAVAGRRAGWIAAALFALDPFVTQYAQETRMYALVILLALVSTACFTAAFAFERGRGWVIAFALAHVALLYTHNWALFLGAGLAAAWVLLLALAADRARRRRLVREGLLAAGIIVLLYLPWLPTMLFQVAHTAAPWANPPDQEDLVGAPERLLGFTGQYVLLVGVVAGFAALLGRRPRPRALEPAARAALALLVTAAVTLLVPYLWSQHEPAWAGRYLAVAVPPLLLLCSITLARAGALGIGVTVLTALLWLGLNGPSAKSNVRAVAHAIAPSLAPGDLVISTQPEQAPVLHHYLTANDLGDLRWATLWGPLTDLGVTDWRDGVDRLGATSPAKDLAPLLDRVKPGGRVALILPDTQNLARWRAPWTALVRQRSAAWEQWMHDDPRFRVVHEESIDSTPPPNSVRAVILRREPVG